MCHACALPHGPFGELCDGCWRRVLAIVERVLGRKMRGEL
jgi:hypothetical protein